MPCPSCAGTRLRAVNRQRRPGRLAPMFLALLVVGVVLAGCTDVGQQADPTAEPGTATATPAAVPTADPARAGGQDGVVGFEMIPELVRDVGPSTVSVEVTAQRGLTTARGTGSGVIWSADGQIVTNNHVIERARDVAVTLGSGRQVPAEVVAADPVTDLAVLSAEADGLPAAEFAQQLPEVGELVVALGNPLGFENTATAGIVSGLDRTLPGQPGSRLVGLIQTDAAISSGNSGGALVNADRQVVGINVAAIGGLPAGAVAENVGFAIPSTTAVPVVEELLATGEVRHAYLGIRGATLTPQIADRFGLDRDSGVLIARIESGGPAGRAGLQRQDIIIGLAGEPVDTFGDLARVLQDHDPGDEAQLTYARGGQRRTTTVVLGQLPDNTATP